MQLKIANIPEFQIKQIVLPDALFLKYKPNFAKLQALARRYADFENILIIGHGGSITSSMAFSGALGTNGKNIQYLSTVDPDYIAQLKTQLPTDKTLVIAISKSGDNITQLEALLQFTGYQMLICTSQGTSLQRISEKLSAEFFLHPAIGGRFVGATEVALAPAAIIGLDVEGIYQGADEFYKKYRQDNIAGQAAQIFYALEQQGIVDVFMPFYSHALFASNNLIIQLCHESFGKAGQGQTYFASEAPESQHHTNQRFFGGRRNISGFFISLENYTSQSFTHVPPGMQSIALKDSDLFELNKMPLQASMHAEFQGTWEDAKIHAIPIVALSVSQITPKEIGAFLAFWQLYALYSALLRGVDPFDQPEVENSKAISWASRKAYKRNR